MSETISRDDLIVRMAELVRDAKVMCMGTVDKAGKLCVTSIGIRHGSIPIILRAFADHVESEQPDELESNEPPRSYPRGVCPCCQRDVAVDPASHEAITAPNTYSILVCVCGAFVIPNMVAEGAVQFRLITAEEIAELPDDVRIELIRRRKYLEERRCE